MTHPLLAKFAHHRLLAILRTDSAVAALAIGRAVVTGGIRLVEVTLTTPGAEAIVRELNDLGDVVVGCGTVLTPEAAREAIGWGAQFIVSPHTDARIVAVAKQQGVLVISGALTPTEIIAAWQGGADLVKVFPVAQLGGLDYLRAIRAPLCEVPLLPTGNIGEQDYLAYLEAGAVAVGLGQSLAPLEEVRLGRWGMIAGRASNWGMSLQEEPAPGYMQGARTPLK